MQIPFAKVDCSGNELKYVREVIESGWLTTAGKCAEFERLFREMVGGKFACAVNSATAALHLAVDAIGIVPGDRVLAPTMTFTSSAEVIRYLGADPVFMDVEFGTCLITPALLREAITRHPGIKALMLVHFGGQAADMEGILEICREHGIRIIEDAAHAFPTRYRGRMIGQFGDVTCFSFYANKTITTGEGGMLVTDDEAIYERAKVMRLHGINRDVWDRFTAKKASWEYDVVAPGFKYNLPDLAAAVGLAQLERAFDFQRQRLACVRQYYRRLLGLTWLDLPVCREAMEDHSWHLFWIVLNEKCPLTRNEFISRLNESGVGTSVHYKPLHRMTYYREKYKLTPEDYPNSEKHWNGAISLPLYPGLSESAVDYICDRIEEIGRAA